jgi:hypothetical protein
MSPRSLVGQSILVTGASSGIRKVNAKLLVAGERHWCRTAGKYGLHVIGIKQLSPWH